MKKVSVSLAALALFSVVVALQPLGAQALGSAGTEAAQGFNSQTLVFELSLFLPQEALGKAFGAGARGAGRGSPGGAAGGAALGGQGPAGGSGAVQPGRDSQRPGAAQFKRDPKLFLAKAQIDRLLPILKALKDNPMPSPSKARQIETDIDTIITKAQKAEYAEWRKEMAKFREELRQRFAASGGQNGLAQGGGQEGAGGTSGPAGANGPGAAPAPRANELQRRQRLLESFVTALEEYRQSL